MKIVAPRWAPQLIPVLLLVALAGIGGVRGLELARSGWAPTAHNERQWMEWAWGQPQERELIPNPFDVDPQQLDLEPGDEVFLVVDAPGLRPSWLRVMSQYALPEQPVVGAGPPEATRRLPETVHRLRLDGPQRPLATAVSLSAGPGGGHRLAALAAGLGSALFLGAVLLWRPRSWTCQPATETTLAFAVGAVPYALLAVACFGLGWSGAWIPAFALLVAAAWALGWRWRSSKAVSAPRRDRHHLSWGSWADGVWIALTGLFVARVALAPLWSWDHFAIWGAKARRIAAVGLGSDLLDPGAGDAFIYTTPHYPLGFPLLEAALASGLIPGGWLFRALHLTLGIGLVILVRRASRSLGASRLAAAAAAALVASSPLLMDTESLGLTEMPLAFWCLAAVALAFDPEERRWSRSWPVGVTLGFLIWIKQEAWILAALLGVVFLVFPLRKRRAAAVTVFAGIAAACAVVQAWAGGEGVSFFTQGPLDRALKRWVLAPEILTKSGETLLAPEWLGFWLLLPAGVGVAAVRRRRRALWLGLVVLAQLAVYVAVYFASYPPPAQHLDSSFFRIAAALVPLGAVALAAAWGGWEEKQSQDASEGAGTDSSGSSSLSPTFLA